MLDIVKKIISKNFTKKGNTGRVKYIVIHYFGALGSAKTVANVFANSDRQASAHYVVDDDNIIQCVEDGDIAWHCGTSGTYVHAECRNANSIGIEVRPYKIDKSTVASASPSDWYFTDKTIQNTVDLTKHLMKKYGIDSDHVIRHYDVTGKWCPRPFMGDDINTYWGVSGNSKWKEFKERLEDDDMDISKLTDAQIDELWTRIRARLGEKTVSDYAKASSKKGVDKKIFADGDKDGLVDDPLAPVLRQELVVTYDRLGLLD